MTQASLRIFSDLSLAGPGYYVLPNRISLIGQTETTTQEISIQPKACSTDFEIWLSVSLYSIKKIS